MNSEELQISNFDIDIAKIELDIIESDKYPSLILGISTERSKNLNDENTGNSYVGYSNVSNNSSYKSYSSLALNYSLYDFGRLSSKLTSQKSNIDSKQNSYCVEVKNISHKLLNTYYETRIIQIKKHYLKKILTHTNRIYTYKKRLNKIGNLKKIDLISNAIHIANLYSDILENDKKIIEKLEHLSNISHYDFKETDVLDSLTISQNILDKKFEDTNESKKLLNEIKIKKSEIDLIQAEYYPTISLYGKYDVYGSSINGFDNSVDYMKENSYKYGLSISWKIFNGFKIKSHKKKAFYELKQLSLEYNKSKRDFQSELNSLNKTYIFNKKIIEENNKALTYSDENIDMNSRLNEIGEVDKTIETESIIKKMYVELDYKLAQEEMAYKLIKKDILLNGDSECTVR